MDYQKLAEHIGSHFVENDSMCVEEYDKILTYCGDEE